MLISSATLIHFVIVLAISLIFIPVSFVIVPLVPKIAHSVHRYYLDYSYSPAVRGVLSLAQHDHESEGEDVTNNLRYDWSQNVFSKLGDIKVYEPIQIPRDGTLHDLSISGTFSGKIANLHVKLTEIFGKAIFDVVKYEPENHLAWCSKGRLLALILIVLLSAFLLILFYAETKRNKVKNFSRPPLKLQKVRHLGRGSYGDVFLVKEVSTPGSDKRFFALKAISKRRLLAYDNVRTFRLNPLKKNSNCASAMKELQALKKLRNGPFILKLETAFQTNEMLYLVTEYYSGKTLIDRLREYGRVLSEETTKLFACEIICGLQYMHNQDIIHRDLSLNNLVLTKDRHVRIVDFGLAALDVTDGTYLTETVGTLEYRAPEILVCERYNKSCDWWSFGVCLYGLLNGRLPFPGKYKHDLVTGILDVDVLEFSDKVTEECIDFVDSLLDRYPHERLGLPDSPRGPIRQHPFLIDVDWEAVEAGQVNIPAPEFNEQNKAVCRRKETRADRSRTNSDLTNSSLTSSSSYGSGSSDRMGFSRVQDICSYAFLFRGYEYGPGGLVLEQATRATGS